jgi:hypothetical protein
MMRDQAAERRVAEAIHEHLLLCRGRLGDRRRRPDRRG